MLPKQHHSVIVVFACTLSLTVYAQKFTVSGSVRDKDTQESLIGATIFCPELKTGTTSNTYGFFSLTLNKKPSEFIVSFVGYQTQTIRWQGDSDFSINIDLSGEQLLETVEITGDRDDHPIRTTQIGAIKLPMSQIKSVPALLGEVDVLKVLQLLPGVQSGIEGSSGLYVRGGGPDQNLILLDGVPVYNAAHLFGFFSVFNADAINQVELIKGGFPARYGGRLSSVIDITMKEGNTKSLKAEGSIGLISSKITIDGPILKDKSSFIVSARRTYLDALARPFQRYIAGKGNKLGYYFYDLNAKVNHRFDERNRLLLSIYSGKDKAHSQDDQKAQYGDEIFTNQENYKLQWGNLTTAARWNSILTHNLFMNAAATYSFYRFNTHSQQTEKFTDKDTTIIESYAADYRSSIRDIGLKADFDYTPWPRHYIRFGGQAIRHIFSPGVIAVNSNVSIDTIAGVRAKNASEFSLYLEDDWEIARLLKVNLGLHNSWFAVDGQHYSSLQPRLAMRVMITSQLAWKSSYSWMTQYIHLLTNSGIGLPTDLWVPATKRVEPQRSTLFSTGLTLMLADKYELNVEAYDKVMLGVLEYQEGANYLDVTSDWQDKVVTGEGKSKGIEFFAHRKTGKISGWIGYTLSWNNRKFEELNEGKWFPYRYDRRHDVELVTSYKPAPMKDFALSWVFASGNAITMPRQTYNQPFEFKLWQIIDPVVHYGDRNSFRMKPYHRLDVSYTVRKKKKWGERSWTFSVYNLYNRKNPFFIQLSYDSYQHKQFKQYSLFPIIPSIAYAFKF
ncbi:MAG TPA: TonB-dependent receptor [Chryseosolibacter sp.]